MTHLNWGDIGSILGSIAAIIAGVRWLLGVYFRQQRSIDAARKHAFAVEAQLLKNEVESLKSTIRSHRQELDLVLKNSEKSFKEYSDSKEAAERVYTSLKEFVASTYERFKKIENGNHPPEEKTVVKEVAEPGIGKVIVKK